jgi:Tfp pilus assembly protein PilO
MKYATYAFYLDRIGRDLGSEEKWTSYCMRRGNANAIIGIAPDAVVDQVMRHDPMTGCLANAYLNHRVGFNVQDAYLERDPSADGLTRAFTHMSIRCNPEVTKDIPKSVLDQLPPDPDIARLSDQVKHKSYSLKLKYKFIKRAPKVDREEYVQMRRNLINAEKRYKDEMATVYQEACRRRFHDEELERQLRGEYTEKEVEPMLVHHLPERNNLQKILSDFNTSQSAEEITDRKVRAIDSMVALASQRELRRPILKKDNEDRPNIPAREEEDTASPSTGFQQSVPLILDKTQCIYCIGDERLSHVDRTRKFSRVSHMMTHVENVHLRREPAGAAWVCHHPECRPLGNFLRNLDHFKSHVQLIRGVKLRG